MLLLPNIQHTPDYWGITDAVRAINISYWKNKSQNKKKYSINVASKVAASSFNNVRDARARARLFGSHLSGHVSNSSNNKSRFNQIHHFNIINLLLFCARSFCTFFVRVFLFMWLVRCRWISRLAEPVWWTFFGSALSLKNYDDALSQRWRLAANNWG